jgi:7,8-dihydropterin-6-yl-methyl-4-(beta-D-ribofuranosyl)aminobenzene 5'-phosphate synthase
MTLRAVDGIEFLVLVDNCLDSLSSVPKNVSLEWPRLMRNGMRELSGEAQCCANHGLSLVIAARVGPASRVLMFDAGPEDYVLERNAPRLGVDFSSIEGIVVSHGHWDHAGGLPAAVRLTAAAAARPVPVYVHPGMFRQRAMTLASGAILPIKAIPTPDELSALGADVLSSDQPQSVVDGCFWISGEIPRVTAYEKGFPGHVRRSADGSGWDPDPLIMDERFVAVHVPTRGWSCLLLVPTRAWSTETVHDLASFNLGVIAPGHCTGWRATQALASRFGEDVVMPSAVGKTYTL